MMQSLLLLTSTTIVLDNILDHLELPDAQAIRVTCKPMNDYVNSYLGNRACRTFTAVGLKHAIGLIRLAEVVQHTPEAQGSPDSKVCQYAEPLLGGVREPRHNCDPPMV
ncbi:hypothetical protein QC764_0098300 [Podospora pseudoanserina]|uniref:F-box domain-containing protein n=1 Tax=Podospora pseudoanserina TaxID=2609844 RepID=A0ABR0HVE6_9PEZI|nr:hypothetical protein QC764_0098300 [Podospora pseudoanserina]